MSKQKYTSTTTATSTTGTARKGREHYSHAKADARKDKRREEAEDRQSKYDALSATARIKLAKSRRGDSKRELARLAKLEAKAVVAQKPFVPVPVVVIAPVVPVAEAPKKKRTKKQVIAESKADRPSKS